MMSLAALWSSWSWVTTHLGVLTFLWLGITFRIPHLELCVFPPTPLLLASPDNSVVGIHVLLFALCLGSFPFFIITCLRGFRQGTMVSLLVYRRRMYAAADQDQHRAKSHPQGHTYAFPSFKPHLRLIVYISLPCWPCSLPVNPTLLAGNMSWGGERCSTICCKKETWDLNSDLPVPGLRLVPFSCLRWSDLCSCLAEYLWLVCRGQTPLCIRRGFCWSICTWIAGQEHKKSQAG